MPRRRIQNERDAANFLADCAIKVQQGSLKSHELHAINCALTTFGNLLKEQRSAQRREELQCEIDEIFDDAPGAKAYVHRNLLPLK